jgi:hypothetical protein
MKINLSSEWRVDEIKDRDKNKTEPNDLILRDEERSVNLLLRFMNVKGLNSVKMPAEKYIKNYLTVNAKSNAPNFIVLLYPFRDGEPLPKTEFKGLNGESTIKIGRQEDRITFRTPRDSWSRLKIKRKDKILVDLK